MATTFEKTWAFDMNRAYAPASALDLTRHTMWQLAANLTGNLGGLTLGLWTLYASCDSVTSGTDATDRWILAGPYDGTKIVRASGAVAHSWIVLKSPTMNGNNWYMLMSFNTGADEKVRITFAKTAFSGGTTTASPTSADSWSSVAGDSGTSAAAGPRDYAINAAATDNSRFSFGLTSAGDWYFLGNKQATGNHNLCIMFHTLSNNKTNDLFPVWTYMGYAATGALFSLAPTAGSTGGVGAFAGAGCRSYDGSAGGAPGAFNLFTQFAVSPANAALATLNLLTADIIDGTHADTPCWVLLVTASVIRAVRGRVADLAISATSSTFLPEATTSPSVGSTDSCRAGPLWFPANAQFNFT